MQKRAAIGQVKIQRGTEAISDTMLPSPDKLKRKIAQPALDYHELPVFMNRLRRVDTVAARCLEFMILTATRQGEARGLIWSELNMSENLWVIPVAHESW